ncbi:TPA: serine O-acetyltransferase, partial [Klebsiella pneumoniae]
YYNNLSLVRACHITVGIKYLFLKKTLIPHPVGIVIGKNVVLGNRCTIYQNVTIGVRNNNEDKYPVLGDNVIVYANACIIGDVRIGNNVIIGSGSLVNKDIPDNAIVKGSPAVVIRFQ